MNLFKKSSRIYNEALFAETGLYVLDPVHSFANFTAQHLMVGQVRGIFTDIDGALMIAEDPLQSTLEFNIRAASINTNHKCRDADLRSERFFNVEKFPELTYKSTRFVPELGGKWTIEGNMTILANMHPVNYSVTISGVVQDPWGNTRVALQGKAKVNRKDFGLLTDLTHETGGIQIGNDVYCDFAGEFILKK